VAAGDRAGFWQRMMSVVATAAPISATVVDTATAVDGPGRLSEALHGISTPLTIVVDECNDVAGPDELAGLAQVVQATYGRTRLVLACRGHPAVASHRWRVNGQLELRLL
jgi:LuxR family maltose regulon positive regulatory protein